MDDIVPTQTERKFRKDKKPVAASIPLKLVRNVCVVEVVQAMEHAYGVFGKSLDQWLWEAYVRRGHLGDMLLSYGDVMNLTLLIFLWDSCSSMV